MKLPDPKPNMRSTDPARAWIVRVAAPRTADGHRRQPYVYGRTKKECTENMIKVLGDVSTGRHVDERRAKFGEHLDRRLRWWESEGELKSIDSYREAIE